MKRNKLFLTTLLITLLVSTLSASAQKSTPAYDIKITFDGLKDTNIILAYYMYDKQLIKDTAFLDNKGVGHFTGNKRLEHGMYMIASPDYRVFELLIDDNQNFSVYCKYSPPEAKTTFSESLKFKNSPINDDYYRFLNMLNEVGARMQVVDSLLKDPKITATKKEELETEKKEIQVIPNNFQDEYIAANPDGYLSKLFLFRKPVEWPDSVLRSKVPNAKYYFYRDHYFDNVDFSEEGLLRTPFFEPKVKEYYDLLNTKSADSIIIFTDNLIQKAEADSEMFKYFVRFTLNRYDTTLRVCMQGVYVNVAFKYYATGKAYWMPDSTRQEIVDKAFKIKDITCGKIAPNIILTNNADGKKLQLHQVKSAHTVLVFWTPECSHCRKEIPQFYEIFKEYADQGLTVYAVCTEVQDDGIQKWKEFIKEHGLDSNKNWINMYNSEHNNYFKVLYNIISTPQFYLLDENKKIILKRIGPDGLKTYFEHEFKKDGDPESSAGDGKKDEEEQ